MGFEIRTDEHSAEKAAEAARAWLASRPAPEPEPPPPPRLPRDAAEGHTHLYVIGSRDAVKIGYARNLYVRVSNLRVDNPHGVELFEHYEMPLPIAKDVERFAHMAFAAQRVSGEWFAIDAATALAKVARIRELLGELYGA